MIETIVSLETARLLKEKGFDVKPYYNYFISSCGKVFNSNGAEMKIDESAKYNRVRLVIDGNSTAYSIHRLVALLFIPNPDNLPQVNHIDGNKRNNNVSNLEWCTASENELHAYKTGLKKGTWTGKKGSEFPLSIPVVCIETGEVFSCTREAAEKYNIASLSGITACCKGTRKSLGGVRWAYYRPNELVKLALEEGFTNYPISFEGDEYLKYLALAQQWIREKGIHIAIYANASGWGWILTKCGGNGSCIKEIEDDTFFDTYEEALEEGLKEVLKLI